jgi:hypothetical protein
MKPQLQKQTTKMKSARKTGYEASGLQKVNSGKSQRSTLVNGQRWSTIKVNGQRWSTVNWG